MAYIKMAISGVLKCRVKKSLMSPIKDGSLFYPVLRN